jgi:hypothetical protein
MLNEPQHQAGCRRLNASRRFIFPERDCSCGAIRYASFGLDGWAGRLVQRVGVIGETKNCYRIIALTYTYLRGRGRRLHEGQTSLIPKHAIRFEVDLREARSA